MRPRLMVLFLCLLATTGCGLAGSAVLSDGTAVMPDEGFDVTDPVLVQSTWWTWAASTPAASNPVSDPTGAHCDHDQQVGVWLLAGSFGEPVTRRCTVPADVPLVGPAVNHVAATSAECDEFLRTATGEVQLGKKSLPLEKLGPVPVTFPTVAGNPVTGEEGEFDGYACGLWFTENGLGPNEYSLTIEGSGPGIMVSVTYELTVEDVSGA
ncbi:hypothetical protein [Actinophytocola sediminis]